MNYVVLVPHPGFERHPSSGTNTTPWPKVGKPCKVKHGRKFLQAKGRWKSISGKKSGESLLQFWCEYEPPTLCEPIKPPNSRANGIMPKYVQFPEGQVSRPTTNTDPWVFKPGFVWSICQHRAPAMKNPLNEGDIVLFGSKKGNQWLLDTVMVIDKQESNKSKIEDFLYGKLVWPKLPKSKPYIGRPEVKNRPFSFVPASRVQAGHAPFPRPAIQSLFKYLSCHKNGKTPTGQNLAKCVASQGNAAFWHEIVALVEQSCGLVLATKLNLPDIKVAR